MAIEIKPFPIREDTAYFAAIGRFVVAYAEAESALHIAVNVLSGLSRQRARAVFGAMRARELVERIRHFVRLKRKMSRDVVEEIESCLKQLELISKERNKLVHRGVAYEAGAITVTNKTTLKIFAEVETDTFSLLDLERMRLDCTRIYVRLGIGVHEPDWLATDGVKTLDWIYDPWYFVPSPRKTNALTRREKRPSRSKIGSTG